MRKFHADVDNLTVELFSCHYMDGTQKKSLGSVEELKVKSAKRDIVRLRKEATELEQAVRNMRNEIRRQERLFAEQEAELKEREQMALSKETSDFLKSEVGKKALERYRILMADAHSLPGNVSKVRVGKCGGKVAGSEYVYDLDDAVEIPRLMTNNSKTDKGEHVYGK